MLVRAAKASGRSVAQEIEYRLSRSLAEDHGKSELEVRLDKAIVELREAVLVVVGYHGLQVQTTPIRGAERKPKPKSRRAQRSEAVGEQPAPTDLADDQRHGDRETGGQSRPVMYKETGEPGQPGRLVPAEISVARGDDGTIALVTRRDGLVIRETPLDIATAQQLAGELVAAAKPKPRSKLPRAQRSQATPDNATPASRKTGGSDGA